MRLFVEINALLMDEKDNVATCVRQIDPGEVVSYRKGDDNQTLTAREEIPFCHKIALQDIPQQAPVFKYGELIGRASRDIPKGCLVSDKNIYCVPRDYDQEMVGGEK